MQSFEINRQRVYPVHSEQPGTTQIMNTKNKLINKPMECMNEYLTKCCNLRLNTFTSVWLGQEVHKDSNARSNIYTLLDVMHPEIPQTIATSRKFTTEQTTQKGKCFIKTPYSEEIAKLIA